MPRKKIAKIKALSQDKGGRYIKNLGWVRNPNSGKFSQRKFFLGHDEETAKLAAARLDALWQCVERRHNKQAFYANILGNEYPEHTRYDFEPGNVMILKEIDPRPTWCSLSLSIAEAIRKGQPVARIALENVPTPHRNIPREVRDWLFRTRQEFSVIHIEFDDEVVAEKANYALYREGMELGAKSQAMLAKPSSSQSLHQAVEEYKLFVRRDFVGDDGETTEWGEAKVRQIDFVKRSSLDLDLVQLGEKSVVSIMDALRGRPAKQNGDPCSESYAKNCLKEFKAFLQWLDKSERFFWTWPVRFEFKIGRIAEVSVEDGLPEQPRRLVKFNNISELTTLYQYARPIQRLHILLGLNCGFINAEQSALRCIDIYFNQQHPEHLGLGFSEEMTGNWISTFRSKSGVFGTWSLWPETVEAIRWWLVERERIKQGICESQKISEIDFEGKLAKGRLLITQNGFPFSEKNRRTGKIPNSWDSLLQRVTADNEGFNRLSFKHLRKTGATHIRAIEDGEVASIYLAHGKPFKGDESLDVYANYPFEKLFEALDKFRTKLQPLWDAVPEAFSEPRKLGGKSNLTPAMRRTIEELRANGISASRVAEQLSLHVSTVHRNTPDHLKKKPRPK